MKKEFAYETVSIKAIFTIIDGESGTLYINNDGSTKFVRSEDGIQKAS